MDEYFDFDDEMDDMSWHKDQDPRYREDSGIDPLDSYFEDSDLDCFAE